MGDVLSYHGLKSKNLEKFILINKLGRCPGGETSESEMRHVEIFVLLVIIRVMKINFLKLLHLVGNCNAVLCITNSGLMLLLNGWWLT